MNNIVLGWLVLLTFLNISSSVSATSSKKPCGYGTADHVLIIGVDGLGSVYLRNATSRLPGLRSFFEQGSSTTRARCHNPSLSGPNWGAIITGMRPEETGINHNKWTPKNGREKGPGFQNFVKPISGEGIPETMFKAAKKQNKNIKTYMSFSWDWIVHLYTNDSVDRIFRGGWLVEVNSSLPWKGPLICPKEKNLTEMECGNITDYRVYNDTLQTIKTIKPNLMFVYLGLSDQAGHDICFGCPEYYDALDIADKYIQDIFDTLNNTRTASGEPMIDKTLVMLTTDHGGYGGTHAFCRYARNATFYPNSLFCGSYNTPAVMKIPVLLRGPGVKKNSTMEENFVSNRDLAPTALNALGLNKGKYMTGRILEEAYESSTCPSESAHPNTARNERSETTIFLVMVTSLMQITRCLRM